MNQQDRENNIKKKTYSSRLIELKSEEKIVLDQTTHLKCHCLERRRAMVIDPLIVGKSPVNSYCFVNGRKEMIFFFCLD